MKIGDRIMISNNKLNNVMWYFVENKSNSKERSFILTKLNNIYEIIRGYKYEYRERIKNNKI